jgi:hypothetical protein
MQPPNEREEADLFRREAMGAFAHEVRTPLTSIKMVMELARRQAGPGDLVLDQELAEMLRTSVEDLQALADDLQETSRLERGKANLSPGPCDLASAIAAAGELLRGVELSTGPEVECEGPWDPARLVRAIAGFAESANRIGEGSGRVELDVLEAPDAVELTFVSGKPGKAERPIAADAGFAFFRSRQLVLAMGGSVHCERAERFATFRVALPLRLPRDAK